MIYSFLQEHHLLLDDSQIRHLERETGQNTEVLDDVVGAFHLD